MSNLDQMHTVLFLMLVLLGHVFSEQDQTPMGAEDILPPPADTLAAFRILRAKAALDTAVAAFQYGGPKAVAQPPCSEEESGYYIFCTSLPQRPPRGDFLSARWFVHPFFKGRTGYDLLEDEINGKYINNTVHSIFGAAWECPTSQEYSLATYLWDNDGDGSESPLVAKTSLIKDFLYKKRHFVCGIQVAEEAI